MTIPPVQAEYTPKGETITEGDLPIYVSGGWPFVHALVVGLVDCAAYAWTIHASGNRMVGRPYTCVLVLLLLTRHSLPTTKRPSTAKPGATKGIIYVPDIFGVSSQAHQVINETIGPITSNQADRPPFTLPPTQFTPKPTHTHSTQSHTTHIHPNKNRWWTASRTRASPSPSPTSSGGNRGPCPSSRPRTGRS